MPGTANFSLAEFGCSCGCGTNEIRPELLEALQEVRDVLNESMTITSGYRCEAHNKAVGGVNTSSHLKGWAADIAVPSSAYAYDIMEALFIKPSKCYYYDLSFSQRVYWTTRNKQ